MGGCDLCKSYIVDSLEMILAHAFPARRVQVRAAAAGLHFQVVTDMTHYSKVLPIKYRKRVSKLESILKDAGKDAAVDYLFEKDSRIKGLFNACILHLWEHGVGKVDSLQHVLKNALFDLFVVLYTVHQEHSKALVAAKPKTLYDCIVDDEHFLEF